MRVRAATPVDAGAFGALIAAGFETYRAFQPAGWQPPTADVETARTAERLLRAGTWARIALEGDVHAGCVLVEPDEAPGTAYLANLFVAAPWWGTGLAANLHGLAVAAMREAGYAAARLLTPERQARARRFYEREGWRPDGEPWWGEQLEMPLQAYRRTLRDG